MRYSPELAARAQAWLARPLSTGPEGKRSAAGLLELATIWAASQNVPLPACIRQCQYSDRVHDLTAYLREYARLTSTFSSMATADTAPAATYQLKPEYAGQTLTDDSYGKAVTADNLTDEDAEHFIKKGFGHVFQKIGAAIESVGAKVEGVGDGLANDEADDQPTEREQQLVEQVSQARAAYDQAADARDKAVEARQLANEALYNEQQAHATTKAQLADVQQQLATAQSVLAALPPAQLQKAMDKASGKATAPDTTPTDSSDATSTSTPTASTSTPTTADTDSTHSDGSAATGSN